MPFARILFLLTAVFLLTNSAFAGEPPYAYVAKWRGQKPGGGIGLGTATLISPSWVITAGHVASAKARDPNRVVRVIFHNGEVRSVERAFRHTKFDLAIARLKRPVTRIKPVAMQNSLFKKAHGTITFTMIGTSKGWHAHRNRKGHGTSNGRFWHSISKGGRPGRAGDSGGAWVHDYSGNKKDILFAVIHGGGRGYQPSAALAWINQKMRASGEKPRWVKKPRKKRR